LLQTVYFGTGYVWLIVVVVVVINNWLRPQCLARLITPCLPGWSPSRLLAVARDNLDVNVLGDGGEGDLEATDGGGVAWLDLSKPAFSAGRVLVLDIGREPVGLAWVESNHHGCPPSIFVHPRCLLPSQIHLRRPVHSVDVVAIRLAGFPIQPFDTLCSLCSAIDMILVLSCLYARCCIV